VRLRALFRRGPPRRRAVIPLAPFAALALALPLAAPACKASTDQGSVQILTVDDPFTGPPAATEITVQAIDYADGGPDGAVTTLAQGSASPGALDLGTYAETTTESILVTATDSAGTKVAWGETLPVELGALTGLTLDVFVQRTGTLSRVPGPLADGRAAPLVSILGGRYILVAGGADAGQGSQTQLYDLVSWAPLASPPTLPLVPQSLAVAQLKALAINAMGAQWYDFTVATASDASAPSGTGTWAEVAGGATVTSTDASTSFVVGATRTLASGGPTSRVLIVSSSGALTWATLTTPRLGAAAAWLDGYGLVVAGGSDGGDATAPGVELLAAGSTNALAVAYPADPTTGSAMAALDGTHVLVVGGAGAGGADPGARVFTIPCNAPPCVATSWEASVLTPLSFAQAFAIDAASAFVTGEDATGAMHAYRLSSSKVAEIPFRLARSHARGLRLPLDARAPGEGPVAIVGGNPTIESFIP
jgi:hypothetical protein